MHDKELFDFISNGNIEKSLYNTCIFLIENSKIEILEETLIYTCSYIGTFINIFNIVKLNDIIQSIINIIDSENINVVEYLILITKMCIICDIYIKHPTTKTGTIPVPKLRVKVQNVFNEDIKLNTNGISKFDIIIPPTDSDVYLVSLKIITSFIRLLKIVENTNSDNVDSIHAISILFRDSFDYIIRKKYIIQTKFCLKEYDSIYFLWGFIYCLYNEPFILNFYKLFMYNNQSCNKTIKNQRSGLIFACSVAVIYSYKKNVASSWNDSEKTILNKINDIALMLFKQIKKEYLETNVIINEPEITEPSKNKIDGLTYLFDYIPKISSIEPCRYNNTTFEDELKTITK
jgi:hypothetical protein